MAQTIIEYDNHENIEAETFKATKNVTKKMILTLVKSNEKIITIKKIGSAKDLSKLILEC